MLLFVSLTLIFIVYFSGLLVPEIWPAIYNVPYMFYVLSIPIALLVLLFFGAWGIAGLARARLSNRPAARGHVRLAAIALIGLFTFFALAVVRALIGYGLPAGSCLLAFDAAVWQDPKSSEFVENDITPRQKMLHDIVRNVIPGRTRAEVEARLGPSLDTSYFDNAGGGLIYHTGPQRDSLFAIDTESLLIWFDDEGKFARFRISSD
jgi:hypothetical protein